MIKLFKTQRAYVVRFAGGLGAQLLSLAVYKKLSNDGCLVYCDLSYFDNNYKIKNPGVSQWKWELDRYGIAINSIKRYEPRSRLERLTIRYIGDTPEKFGLGIRAIQSGVLADINFAIHKTVVDNPYICLHVRKGDYLKVASYMLPDEYYIDAAKNFNGLIDTVIVVSDGVVGKTFTDKLFGIGYKNVLISSAKCLHEDFNTMLNANVLISSNSQYSLAAGLLNPNCWLIAPKKWHQDKHKKYEAEAYASTRALYI